MRTLVFVFLTFLLTFLVQTSPLLFAAGSAWRVDLVLLVVVYFSLFWGGQQALLLGFWAGLAQDALSSELMGLHALSKSLAAFVVLSLCRQVQVQNLAAQELFALVAFLTDTLARLMLMGILQMRLWSFAAMIVPMLQQLLLTAVLVPLVCWGLQLAVHCLRVGPEKAWVQP